MSYTREQVYEALRVSLASISSIVTVSRRLKHWANVPADQQPYVGISQARESAIITERAPIKWRWHLDLYLYCSCESDGIVSTVLNPLLDDICAKINKVNPVTGKNTLGLPDDVQFCRVEGDIETDEGTLGNQAVAIIPVVIFIVQQ